MVELGTELGFQRSADTGRKKFDGTFEKSINSGRTSTNAFCQRHCETDPVTVAITTRMENITGVPQVNYEFLQLLRYEEGQFYNTHHDYSPYHLERQFGARVITIFLYLNDVDEGGATDFPQLGFAVLPRKGMALVWPSVTELQPPC
jgi:prolyl 4-hydroxylase